MVSQASKDKSAALALAPVSRETEQRLDAFVALLSQWQAKTNLVAPSTLPAIWTRHVADSLQLIDFAPEAKIWLDLGSGGGFPGIVLACAMAERGGRVHLVERTAKKAAFLREALRVTGAPGEVHMMDNEDYVDSTSVQFDCVTARALAPLKTLLGVVEPIVSLGTIALFPKGQDVESELTEATKYWNVEFMLHPSRTNSSGAIVKATKIVRRSNYHAAAK